MLFAVLVFLLLPTSAFAWGPVTHVYLGSEILFLSSALPAAVYGLIRKYKQDYLYGNLMADMVLGKKYLPLGKNTHNWDVAVGLAESAKTQPEKAFSLGYMSHLAADTVAHGKYTAGLKDFRHAFMEFRADSLIDKSYWLQAVSIDSKVQARGDAFLENSIERVVFSFKTNKRIFKTAVALSCFNRDAMQEPDSRRKLEGYHEESLDRIIDVLKNGSRSEVLKKDPTGRARRRKSLLLR